MLSPLTSGGGGSYGNGTMLQYGSCKHIQCETLPNTRSNRDI